MKWDSRGRLGTQGWEIWDTAEQMGKNVLSTVYMPRISILVLLMKWNHAVKAKECLACFYSALKLKVRVCKEKIEVRTFLSQIIKVFVDELNQAVIYQ